MFDEKKTIWLWLDKNCFSEGNVTVTKYLREKGINIIGFEKMENMQEQINQIQSQFNSPKINTICAASVPDENFHNLQNKDTVKEIVIYCANQKNGKKRAENFGKVKQVFIMPNELAEYILAYDGV